MNEQTRLPDDNVAEREKLWALIKDIRFAMFTTRHHNGHLHSRPMTTQNSAVEEDSSLWFFMARSGEPVADLITDPVVNVVYADPDEDSYVSVSGIAAVIEDAAKNASSGASSTKPGSPAARPTPTSRWSRSGSCTRTTGT